MVALRDKIIGMKNARKEDNETAEESIDINEELNKIFGNQASQVVTLGSMLSENTERYDAIINKVGELTIAEIREAAALQRQTAHIEEQIRARQRLIEIQNESIRSSRNVAETTAQAVDRLSKSWVKTTKATKAPTDEMKERWAQTGKSVEQAALSMQNSLINLGASFMESLGFIIVTGDGIGQAFLGILENIADMAVQLGMIIVASGKAIDALKAALIGFFGGSAIAAGAALIAIGAAAKGAIRGLASRGGSGGGSSVTGGSPTARSVPATNQEVVFRIGNNELIGSLQQAGVIDQRVGKRRNFGGA